MVVAVDITVLLQLDHEKLVGQAVEEQDNLLEDQVILLQ